MPNIPLCTDLPWLWPSSTEWQRPDFRGTLDWSIGFRICGSTLTPGFMNSCSSKTISFSQQMCLITLDISHHSRYIFTALCKRNSSLSVKIACSAVSFVFVFLWHGMYTFVCIWAGLNFVVLGLENVGRSICMANRSLIDRHLSAANQRRFTALLGSQLYIVGALSNFLFFAGADVGDVFFRRTYLTGGWVAYGCVSAMCVCLFHTAEWVCVQGRVL